AAAELLVGQAPRWEPVEPRVVEAVTRDPLVWFDAERPALVAAVLRAGQAGLDEVAWELSASMSVYLTVRGMWQEAYAVHEEAMRATGAAGNRRGELQAALLVAGAGCGWWTWRARSGPPSGRSRWPGSWATAGRRAWRSAARRWPPSTPR